MNEEIKQDEFSMNFICQHGIYNIKVIFEYKPTEKMFRIVDLQRLDPSFESFLIDEEEICNKASEHIKMLLKDK